MTTALTLYMTNTNDGAGRTLVNAAGGASVGVDTLLGTATGWAEIPSQGTGSAWAALGAIGTPSGKGWLYDNTSLEQQAFVSGNWTPTIRVTFNGANANATVTFRFRAFKVNGSTYTLIADSTTAAQTISTTATTYALTAVSVGEIDFVQAGDKIYGDLWVNVTANSNTAGAATFRLNESNSTTQGNATNQIVTPGYNAITAISLTDSASGAEAESSSTTFSLADANTLQALTAFLTNVASSTLSTAAQIITTGGGASSGVDTTLGTATGYGEIFPRGTGSAWQSLGGYPASPSGHGLVLDASTLDYAQFVAGNWQPTLRLTLHNGNADITADLTVRLWLLLNGASAYSALIATSTLAAQTIHFATSDTFTLPSTSVASFGLNAGDKLYLEILANVTSNPNTASSATLRINLSQSATNGATNAQVTTPGYTLTDLQDALLNSQQFTYIDSASGGTGIAFAARPPLSSPYALPNVPTGGPYVIMQDAAFWQSGALLPRMYGSTFYPATQGGSPLWQASDGSTQRFIDGVIATYRKAGLLVLRPTDQWGSNAALSWDNPAIWTNMDYLVQQAAQAGLYVQMDLSGYKSVLTAAGMYAFTASFWADFLTAVGNHYKNVNNILFYTIAGEPTFPRTQADVNALVSFFTATIATLKAADPNHLISPGGFISMNNGLANWWQQVWAIAGVDVCCYKSYSLNDLNNAGTYSAYAVNTLGKIACQQEFGLQQYMGDGVYTGQVVNSLTMDRADYYNQIYAAGELNGTRAFIFWNYDHQGDSVNWAADVPYVADNAVGIDSVTVNGNKGISIQDYANGSELWTGLTQSYDLDPVNGPVTWGIVLQRAIRPGNATPSDAAATIASSGDIAITKPTGGDVALALATIGDAL